MTHIYYLVGVGTGLVISSFVFWMFFLQVELSKQHDYNKLAIELFAAELIILIVGVCFWVYAFYTIWIK